MVVEQGQVNTEALVAKGNSAQVVMVLMLVLIQDAVVEEQGGLIILLLVRQEAMLVLAEQVTFNYHLNHIILHQ